MTRHRKGKSVTDSAPPKPPIDIQAKLDEWLAANPDAQKYVSKLYYLPGLPGTTPLPADVTHTIRLGSAISIERALLIGLVVLPQYAVVLDALLAMLVTQPPA